MKRIFIASLVVVAIGAAGTHRRADGEAFLDWDDTEPRRPEDVPQLVEYFLGKLAVGARR